MPGSYAKPVGKRPPSSRRREGVLIWLIVFVFIFVVVAITAACCRSKGRDGGECGEGWFFFGGFESDTHGVDDDAGCGDSGWDGFDDFDIFDG